MKIFFGNSGEFIELDITREINIDSMIKFIDESRWKKDIMESFKGSTCEINGTVEKLYKERILEPLFRNIVSICINYDKTGILYLNNLSNCGVSKRMDFYRVFKHCWV